MKGGISLRKPAWNKLLGLGCQSRSKLVAVTTWGLHIKATAIFLTLGKRTEQEGAVMSEQHSSVER